MTFHSVCQPLNVYGWHSPLDSFFHFFCWVDNKKEIGKSNRTTNPFGYFTSFSPLLQDDTTTRRRKERDSRTSFLFSAQSRQLFVSLHLIGPNVQGNDDGPAVVDANNFFFSFCCGGGWEKKSQNNGARALVCCCCCCCYRVSLKPI